MNYIKGKFKKIIYENVENGYIVSLFKVEETNDPDVQKFIDKSLTVTGTIFGLKMDARYTLNGQLSKHPKYSWQYSFVLATINMPTTKESIIEFLTSSFVEGCGKTTAKKIVDTYGEKSLEIIKDNYHSLLEIKGITELRAVKIYNSLLNYEKNDIIVKKLNNLGFSLEEAAKIVNKYPYELDEIINGNLYILKDLFDFKKLDDIYISNFDKNSEIRVKECILNSMMQISFNEGTTYYSYEDVLRALNVLFNISLSSEEYLNYLEILIKNGDIVKIENNYFLNKYYTEEKEISYYLKRIVSFKNNKIKDIDKKISEIEKEINITYNDDQKKAIKESLNNNISLISGGPGTGKTTIVNAIVKLFIKEQHLKDRDLSASIALLAPTGRASKKLSMATGLGASTIHRYLKWHKENDTFEYNEQNKHYHKLVIVDESSMLDVSLTKSLLCALSQGVRIVFVGDIYQLPSVGPGLVLHDLIESDMFAFTLLNTIYRQSENSYIPFLAKDIKSQNIDDDFMFKRDDYNFIICDEDKVLNYVSDTIKYALSKNIDENDMQVLAPMYKGQNGIDNLNICLQNIYNPFSFDKSEIKYADKTYRENDKVLQLVNDSDNNVFNGDIGKIVSITKSKDNKIMVHIDFDGNYVIYEKKDLKNITHAYAITIHKSQGSEFSHVIMPVCRSYHIMLYNKLLYTGVSRAKKSLILIGDPRAFTTGIQNNYAKDRKTSLKQNIINDFSA